jgi:hypothetical protein
MVINLHYSHGDFFFSWHNQGDWSCVSCKQLWLGLFNFETDYESSAKGMIGAF